MDNSGLGDFLQKLGASNTTAAATIGSGKFPGLIRRWWQVSTAENWRICWGKSRKEPPRRYSDLTAKAPSAWNIRGTKPKATLRLLSFLMELMPRIPPSFWSQIEGGSGQPSEDLDLLVKMFRAADSPIAIHEMAPVNKWKLKLL